MDASYRDCCNTSMLRSVSPTPKTNSTHIPQPLRQAVADRYKGEEFVKVLGPGQIPHTRHVRGSNHCLITVVQDRRRDRAIVISVIDNLVKGASGQAMQNLNLILGVPENTNVSGPAVFP